MGITDLSTYLIGVIFIVLLPGPNSLFVLTTAGKKGVAAGYQAALGVFVGDAILMLAAALGAASLLKAFPTLFVLIKLIGALYLGWIGFSLIKAAYHAARAARRSLETAEPTRQQESPPLLGTVLERPFHKALMISLVNPKAILFFVTFFIQFVDPSYAYPALTFLVLGALAQVISALYLSGLIFGARHLGQFFYRQTWLSVASNALVGLLFFAFALRLALSHL